MMDDCQTRRVRRGERSEHLDVPVLCPAAQRELGGDAGTAGRQHRLLEPPARPDRLAEPVQAKR